MTSDTYIAELQWKLMAVLGVTTMIRSCRSAEDRPRDDDPPPASRKQHVPAPNCEAPCIKASIYINFVCTLCSKRAIKSDSMISAGS